MRVSLNLILVAGVSLMAFAPAHAKEAKLGKGEFFVWVAPGHLPHVDADDERNQPARFSYIEFDQLQYLYEDCRKQLDPMRPSILKTFGITMLRNAPGIALGTAGGAVWAFGNGVNFNDYAKYGAGAGIGSSFGAAFTGQSYGDRYTVAGCMSTATDYYKNSVGALKGVRIIFNAYPVNGHRKSRPTGEPGPQTNSADTGTSSGQTPPTPQ